MTMLFHDDVSETVDIFFEEASKRNMRVIAGLTGTMSRIPAPDDYVDTAETFYRDSKALYKKWHGNGRNLMPSPPIRFRLHR